ncbi:DUF7352 domain-containing protein [Bacillus mesophilum]|uniref:DUF7352 domain-containing protein n=1 Tax=Bacillus mesophilum TaxID=1071718 RepID=A0A7V7UVQ9_9BACI|nr:hypothetical protein [Bacillus mesophilum]KAB2329434.1 hypothetical protein F7732_21145 [Bacillus mesophilum]
MNNTIWKYVLKAGTLNEIDMPFGCELLSVETQGEDIVIYALVNTKEDKQQKVEVRTYGTGHDIDTNLTNGYKFLGTANLQAQSLMFHVFYKKTSTSH